MQDEDLIAVCVQMAAVKGAEIVRMVERKEEEHHQHLTSARNA